MTGLDSLLSLIQVVILDKGIVALDLDTLEPAKGLKQLLEVTLPCAVHVKVHNEEGGGGCDVLPPSVLTALDLPVTLSSRPNSISGRSLALTLV